MPPDELNPVYLTDIYEAGGVELAREVADTFLAEAPRRLQALHDAVSTGDWSAASLAAHTIVSGASMLGLEQVAAAARRVELVATEGRAPPSPDIQALSGTVSAARATLTRAIEELDVSGALS